jgi:hypothetical protein
LSGLSNAKTVLHSMRKHSSDEFLLISECVTQTVQGMWGNAPRPQPVREIKQIERDLSVGFGPRKEYAAALLRADALQGALPIYVRASREAQEGAPGQPRRVPPKLLRRVLLVRHSLPDHPTHIRRIGAADRGEDDALLLLHGGQLVVRRSDFLRWYKRKHAKGKWPSQANKAASGRGTPTKDTGALRNAILAIVHDGAWQATQGMPDLRRLLIERGHMPPGRDTLAQAVDQLHRLTGEPALRRKVRRRARPETSRLAKKSKPFRSRNRDLKP